ncbi:MAG: hypothetical protein GY774_37480 [Planctomycetes bacterium]|nr:hypothetical protein [Planctomycetota bacterium]
MKVNFRDILEAFEFVSFNSMYEHQAFLNKETGKIYWYSEYGDDMDELPQDIDDGNYIAIPHKNELDLGSTLVFDFAYRYLPDDVKNIREIFRRKGAYATYKSLLEKKGMLEYWSLLSG